MSKKAKIIAGFTSAVVIGAGVPTAVVWGVKDKITNSSNSGGSVTPTPTPDPSISIDDTLLKDNVGNDVIDTSILDDLLNDANSDQIKNELINSGIINSDAESLIKKLYFKLSDNTSQVPGQYVNVDLHAIKTDNTDVELSKNIPTKVGIINFNKENFLNSFSSANINTLYNSLQSAQIINTIYGFNAGFPQSSLLKASAELSSKSQLLPSDDTWLVNFDMQLNNNFVYKTSDDATTGQPTFTDKVIAEDCATSSTQNIDIDLSGLIQSIGTINSVTNANNLKDNNEQLKTFVNDANIVFNNNWIRDVALSVSKANGDDGEYLAFDISVTLFNGKKASTNPVLTQIKVVNLNEEILKSYFETSVNDEEQINPNNLLATLNSSNCGLSLDCLNSSTIITLNGTHELENVSYNKYNLNVNLKDSYCFFDITNNQISTQKNIDELLSKIPSQYTVNTTELENDITNTVTLDKLNEILSKNPDELLAYVKSFNIVDNPNFITSCSLEDSVQSNKVKLTYTIQFSDGNEIIVSALTGMNVVTYNEESIRNVFKTVSSSLSGQALVSKIVSADSGLNSALSNSTTMNTIDDTYVNDSNHIPHIKCNIQLLLNSNYCFVLNGKYIDSASINDVETGIKYNYSYNVQNVESATSKLVTIDQINNLKNPTNLLNVLKQNDFVTDSSWISSVSDIQYVIENGYIAYNAQIHWTDGTSVTLNFKTGLKGLNADTYKNYIESFKSKLTSCYSDEEVNQLATTTKNNITQYGFPAGSVSDVNLTLNTWWWPTNRQGVYSSYNVQFIVTEEYGYIDSGNNLSNQINLGSVKTWVPYNVDGDWTAFDNACLGITNSFVMQEFLNDLTNNINKYNVFESSEWIQSITFKYGDQNNQQPVVGKTYVTITITYAYFNGDATHPTKTHIAIFNALQIVG